MNRRTLKKHCWRAAAILIAEHGYHADAFQTADGTETVDAPPSMERRAVEHGFLSPGPLKGTPLMWELDHNGEVDAKLPSEVLAEIRYWSSLSADDIAEMLRT
jgi:hypothetical protein